VDCLTQVDYYLEFIVVTITPACLLFLIIALYLIPAYLNREHRSPEDNFVVLRQKQRNSWKLFCFAMFLIYPKVSSTVLMMYNCRNIEGVYYMVADFNLRCYDARWHSYLGPNIIAILVYPVGIPTFFFILLLLNRHRFFKSGVRLSLGLLYDGYAKDVWWFELVDISHKLFLTSILAFIPTYAQAPTGMCIVILYALVILLNKPYYRKGDDRLHLFAQVELFMLLLAGYIFYEQQTPDELSDVAMSIFLIAMVLLFILLFVTQSANIIGKIVKLAWAARKADFEKRQQEEEKDVDVPDQGQSMYGLSGDLMVEAQLQMQEAQIDLASPTMRRFQ